MKLLLLYKTAPESASYQTPSSFGVQGNLLARGLNSLEVDFQVVDRRDKEAKEKSYSLFKPDWVIGIGYWGDVPEIVSHPLHFGQRTAPWLVSDGAVLGFQDELNKLPLILASSRYVKSTFVRDGISEEKIKVVYQGVDTEVFQPLSKEDKEVRSWRTRWGIDKELMLLTIGGDGKSKGFQEVVQSLKILGSSFSNWRYVVKVANSETGRKQTQEDLTLAENLGLKEKVVFFSEMLDEEKMAQLINAADIYLSPSHNEGFCRPLVEAQSCGLVVITVDGTTTKEVVRNGYSGFTAKVKERILKKDFEFAGEKVVFPEEKEVGVIADSADIARYLQVLSDSRIRERMGKQARDFAVENFDYRVSANNLVKILTEG